MNIVPPEVVQNGFAAPLAGRVAAASERFSLDDRKEALCAGVVPAVAFATPAADEARIKQEHIRGNRKAMAGIGGRLEKTATTGSHTVLKK